MKNNYEYITNGMPVPFEPKQTNRFTVLFPEEFEINPSTIFKVSPIIMDGGSMKVDPITFYMYDPISPSTSQAINEGLRYQRTRDDRTIQVKLNSVGPVGDIVEEWVLYGTVESVNFGEFDWSEDTHKVIQLKFNVRKAIHNY